MVHSYVMIVHEVVNFLQICQHESCFRSSLLHSHMLLLRAISVLISFAGDVP